jgi:hypothetical protein
MWSKLDTRSLAHHFLFRLHGEQQIAQNLHRKIHDHEPVFHMGSNRVSTASKLAAGEKSLTKLQIRGRVFSVLFLSKTLYSMTLEGKKV